MSILWVVAMALAQQPRNEAEELFQSMESAIFAAKTLQYSSKAKAEGQQEAQLDVTVLVAQGNMSRLKMEGTVGGGAVKVENISDGKHEKTLRNGRDAGAKDVNDKLTETYFAITSRAGLITTLLMSGGQSLKSKDLRGSLPLSDFKMGKKEKIGDVEAQSIECKIAAAQIRGTWAMTLWIDPKTKLLLKRVLKQGTGAEGFAITETYEGMKLDEKVDDARFVLP